MNYCAHRNNFVFLTLFLNTVLVLLLMANSRINNGARGNDSMILLLPKFLIYLKAFFHNDSEFYQWLSFLSFKGSLSALSI